MSKRVTDEGIGYKGSVGTPNSTGNNYGGSVGRPARGGNDYDGSVGSPNRRGNEYGGSVGSPASSGNGFGGSVGAPTSEAGFQDLGDVLGENADYDYCGPGDYESFGGKDTMGGEGTAGFKVLDTVKVEEVRELPNSDPGTDRDNYSYQDQPWDKQTTPKTTI